MTTDMLTVPVHADVDRPSPGTRPAWSPVVTGVAAVAAGAAVAYLVAGGLWFVALGLLLAVPVFVLVHRVPLAGIAIWLLVDPLVVEIGGGVRMVYWAVHRVLPVAVLTVLVLTGMLRIRSYPLRRIGGPEVLMLGYLLVSVLSIAYTSDELVTSLFDLYDRVVIPMCLYLLIRLLHPTEATVARVLPIVVFVAISQIVIGAISWTTPGALPSAWLGRVGERTTGTLSSPSVYGVTVIAAGVLLTHAMAYQPSRWRRAALAALALGAWAMAVFTFTRGVWLGALAALVALVFVHPRLMRRMAVVVVPVLVLVVASGALTGQIGALQDRYSSDETALDRLPLAYAALQMVEEKPITGWGFNNFDKFDREFQRPVNDFVPEKDHSSHNVYLTLLAEQGVPGLMLFLGAAAWWLLASLAAYARLPASGFVSRKLLVLLWSILAGHFIANNFSNMKVVFGLGQWWMVLGLIAVIVTTEREEPAVVDARDGTRIRVGG